MQLDPACPTMSPGIGTRHASGGPAAPLVVANLGRLFQGEPRAQARHEAALERRAERRLRREGEQQEAVAAAAASPRASDVMRQAEQRMAPGSAASRDEQIRSAEPRAGGERAGGFRRALAQAGGQAQQNAASSTPDPTRPTGAPRGAVEPEATSGAARAKGENATAGGATVDAAAARTPMSVAPGAAGLSTPRAGVRLAVGSAPKEAAAVTLRPAGSVAATGRPASATTGPSVAGAAAAPGRGATTTVGVSDAAPGVRLERKAAAPQAAAQTPDDAERNTEANIERILRHVQARIGKDRSTATLRLDPPELGAVRLHMDLRGEQLALQLETQTPAARRVLEEQLDSLRRSLEASGIQVERIELRSGDGRIGADPAQQDGPPGHQEGWAGREPRSGGEARPGGGDAAVERDAALEGAGAGARPEDRPAAESLVDILA